MSRHTINYDDLNGFDFEYELASSFGKGENKKLCAHVILQQNKNYEYTVYADNKIVKVTNDLKVAIETYNES